MTDQIDEAKTALEQAVTMDENNKKLLADEIKKVKDLDESQESIDKAVQKENYNSALYFVNEKLRHCPGSEKLKLDKLEYMMKAGKNEDANTYSQQLFDDMSSNSRYLYLRGLVLVNEGNFALGKKFFTQALKSDPDYAPCQKAMKKVKKMDTLKQDASNRFKSGDYQGAIKGFTECLELFPNNKSYNASIYLNRAICYSKLKQQENALKDLNQAIE